MTYKAGTIVETPNGLGYVLEYNKRLNGYLISLYKTVRMFGEEGNVFPFMARDVKPSATPAPEAPEHEWEIGTTLYHEVFGTGTVTGYERFPAGVYYNLTIPKGYFNGRKKVYQFMVGYHPEIDVVGEAAEYQIEPFNII